MDKLLGKIEFEEPLGLTDPQLIMESKLEEKHLDLWVYTSPATNAKGIGGHLGCFSRKYYPLPCYLIDIENWLDNYSDTLLSDKKFKNFKQYPSNDLMVYLLHKTFICKIVKNTIFSTNHNVLTAVNHIKVMYETHKLVGKAEKYLGVKLNPNALSEADLTDIKKQIEEAKGEEE